MGIVLKLGMTSPMAPNGKPFGAFFKALLLEAIPFLLIGVAIATAARAWDPRGLGCNGCRAIRCSVRSADCFGLCTAGLCGNVPVAGACSPSAPMGASLGFLFAAPVLNLIVLLSTWAAFLIALGCCRCGHWGAW